MKEKIHPQFFETTITCACGNSFLSYSTKTNLRVEICSACHPFFTGKQKAFASKGRVERFQMRYRKKDPAAQDSQAAEASPAPIQEEKDTAGVTA